MNEDRILVERFFNAIEKSFVAFYGDSIWVNIASTIAPVENKAGHNYQEN